MEKRGRFPFTRFTGSLWWARQCSRLQGAKGECAQKAPVPVTWGRPTEPRVRAGGGRTGNMDEERG